MAGVIHSVYYTKDGHRLRAGFSSADAAARFAEKCGLKAEEFQVHPPKLALVEDQTCPK